MVRTKAPSVARHLRIVRTIRELEASRHRRDDGDLVVRPHFRLQSRAEPDVLVVEVHVHELAQLALLIARSVASTGTVTCPSESRRSGPGMRNCAMPRYSPSRETTSCSDLFPPVWRGRWRMPARRRS